MFLRVRAALVAVVVVVVAVAGVAAIPTMPLEVEAMQNSGLFQGDIKGVAGQNPGEERAAILDEEKLWTNGVVPYVFGTSVDESQQDIISKAMNDFHSKTCVRFTRRTTEANFIEIVSNDTGCWSSVGMDGGSQRLSLDAEGCMDVGTAIHELMHALGFFHEQNRPDRDDYVTILWDNIIPEKKEVFFVEKSQYVGEKYNYKSIMHYDSYAFSKKPDVLKTIVPKDPKVVLVDASEKLEMEKSDANQINKLYAKQCARRNNTNM